MRDRFVWWMLERFERIVVLPEDTEKTIEIGILQKSKIARKCLKCGAIVTHPLAHVCGEPEKSVTPSGYAIGTFVYDDFPYREDVLDLPCVKCQGAMTTGLGTGYKGDWDEQPHCSVCNWEDYDEYDPLAASLKLKNTNSIEVYVCGDRVFDSREAFLRFIDDVKDVAVAKKLERSAIRMEKDITTGELYKVK